MTDIYKQALCLFIQDGVLTLEQVQEKVQVVESTLVEKTRQTPFWVAAEALCNRLNDGIVANHHRPFRVNVTSIGHMEKLLRIDKVSVEDAEAMIDWCLGHEFWGTVIFSPVKFRKHYFTMVARRDEDNRRYDIRVNHPTMASAPKVFISEEELAEQMRKRQQEAVPMPEGFRKMVRL